MPTQQPSKIFSYERIIPLSVQRLNDLPVKKTF